MNELARGADASAAEPGALGEGASRVRAGPAAEPASFSAGRRSWRHEYGIAIRGARVSVIGACIRAPQQRGSALLDARGAGLAGRYRFRW